MADIQTNLYGPYNKITFKLGAGLSDPIVSCKDEDGNVVTKITTAGDIAFRGVIAQADVID